MSVKSGQAVTVIFPTAHPATGAPADADATPTGTLYVNGAANAATVTVTNITTGRYKAAVTLPALTAGDVVSLLVAATVASAAGESCVWQDTADTALVSDVHAKTTNLPAEPAAVGSPMTLTSAYDSAKTAAPTVAAITASVWGNSTRTLSDKTGFALTASYDSSKYSTMSTVWTDAKAGYLTGNVALAASLADAITGIGVIPTTPLLAASYTAPDNASIAAIKAKTDNLPSDPADASVVAGLIDALPTAAENADAVWDEAISGHVTDGTAGRLLQRIYRYFFNKRSHTNSAVTVYADDGATADATMVVSGDTTTVTKDAPS